MVDRVNQIRRCVLSLSEKLGRDPTDDELAEEMNLPVSKFLLMAVSKKPSSLESPNDQEGAV